MEKSETKQWVEANISLLLKQFGISHWKVVIEYCAEDSESYLGTCLPEFEYEQALIKLNLPRIDDATELREVLEHELCHIIHAPFEMYRKALGALVTEKEFRALEVIFTHASELTVKNLERMRAGHVKGE